MLFRSSQYFLPREGDFLSADFFARCRSRKVSNTKKGSQEDQISSRPPEYTIIHRHANTNGATASQSKKTRQSKKDARLAASETRREQRRDQRYRSQRRKQWVLAAAIVALFIAVVGLGLHALTNNSNNSNNSTSPNFQPPVSTVSSNDDP